MTIPAILLFLDFDGVLRRADSPKYRFDEDCLDLFQEAVRSLESLQIVVSSSWKDGFTLSEIRVRFAPDMAERIIGVTPSLLRMDEHRGAARSFRIFASEVGRSAAGSPSTTRRTTTGL